MKTSQKTTTETVDDGETIDADMVTPDLATYKNKLEQKIIQQNLMLIC